MEGCELCSFLSSYRQLGEQMVALGASALGLKQLFKHPVNYFNKWKLPYNASRLEKKTLIAEVQRSKEEEIS